MCFAKKYNVNCRVHKRKQVWNFIVFIRNPYNIIEVPDSEWSHERLKNWLMMFNLEKCFLNFNGADFERLSENDFCKIIGNKMIGKCLYNLTTNGKKSNDTIKNEIYLRFSNNDFYDVIYLKKMQLDVFLIELKKMLNDNNFDGSNFDSSNIKFTNGLTNQLTMLDFDVFRKNFKSHDKFLIDLISNKTEILIISEI